MFKSATVDSILSDLNKKIEQLQALAAAESANADKKRNDAQVLVNEAALAEAEATRARKISANIAALVS